MNADALPLTADERAILPLLPMLYVAWADGELTADELSALRARLPGGSPGLDAWLDPGRPPSAAALADLLQRLRRTVQALGLEVEARRSLVALGRALAPHTSPSLGTAAGADDVALLALEQALGLYGSEYSRHFFPPPPAPAEDSTRILVTPPFSVEALTALLDGPHASWKARVRALLAAPSFRHPGEITAEAYREQVLAWCQELARQGMTESLLPAATGGRPDLGGFVATFETLACFDLSLLVKFGVQFGLFGCSVLFLGDAEQRQRYLGDILSLRLPGCFAMTERDHGSNVRDLETTATYDPERDEFVIDTPHDRAGKEWIGNAAAHGRMATVFAQLRVGAEEHGVHAFLVPIRGEAGAPLPGVRIADCGHKMGLNGVDNGRLWFDAVRVPRSALLARFAQIDGEGRYQSPIASASRRFFTMLGALVGGRVSVAAASVTVARSALTIALRYAARRRQFGPPGGPEVPLLHYPIVQERLLTRLATTYALHFAVAALIGEFAVAVEGGAEDMREIEAQAAGLKALASGHATDTVQVCREACGGQGYAAINRFAALKADSDVFSTFEGDNTVLLQLVARALLGRFRARFADPNPLALLRHLGHLAATTVAEKNPLITRWSSSEHLRDGAFHHDLFVAREEEQARLVARGIQRELHAGVEPFAAIHRWQVQSIRLAQVHVERLIQARFRAAVEGCADPALRATLNDLCDLYALSRLEADRAWLLERGYLTAAKSQRLRAEVGLLCAELAPRAGALVDAFAIPPTALGAPIAL